MATIIPENTKITGLDNYNLTDQTRFDTSTGFLISNTPIFLVAHNGNAYDFPLANAEMEKASIQFGSEIYCSDTSGGNFSE